MNIVVPVKQVPDTGIPLRIKEGQIDESQLKWVLSPYDEFALEESLKLKQQWGAKIFALTLGPERAKEALLTALALGADEAFHLVIDKIPTDPLTVATILKDKLVEIPDVSVVFCGKLSTDSNNFAVPQMLAGLMGFPFVSNVSKLDIEDKTLTLNRECGGGVEEVLKAQPPVVLSADKGLNTPRYPSLPGIMKAKKKPFQSQKVTPQDEKIKSLELKPPAEKQAPVILKGSVLEQVKELVTILKDKVL